MTLDDVVTSGNSVKRAHQARISFRVDDDAEGSHAIVINNLVILSPPEQSSE